MKKRFDFDNFYDFRLWFFNLFYILNLIYLDFNPDSALDFIVKQKINKSKYS